MVLFIFVCILFLVLFLIIYKRFKHLKLPNVVLITGGVKTGKTSLGVCLSIKNHKKVIRRYYVRKFFRFIFTLGKAEKEEMPLLYSNIPLKYKYYVPIKKEHLLRQERFNYKSVIFLSEGSLIADSQYLSDKNVNEQLLLFNKLIGHSTKGGMLIYDTQCLSDVHYAIKRCINSYLWIHSNTKVPFFMFYKLRECVYSYDNSSINTFDDDVDKSVYNLLVSKRVWKKFDCYCYSCLTDDLPHPYELIKKCDLDYMDLKAHNIISFKEFKGLKALNVLSNKVVSK